MELKNRRAFGIYGCFSEQFQIQEPSFLSQENKNLRKEKNPDPEIHRFRTVKRLKYIVCALSELWRNHKIRRFGGLDFGNEFYGVLYISY